VVGTKGIVRGDLGVLEGVCDTTFGIVQLLFHYGPLHYITYILRALPIRFRALGRRLCAT